MYDLNGKMWGGLSFHEWACMDVKSIVWASKMFPTACLKSWTAFASMSTPAWIFHLSWCQQHNLVLSSRTMKTQNPCQLSCYQNTANDGIWEIVKSLILQIWSMLASTDEVFKSGTMLMFEDYRSTFERYYILLEASFWTFICWSGMSLFISPHL